MPSESLLPAAIDAEKAILGSILLDGAKVYEAAAWVRPEDFLQEGHRRLFTHMLELADAGKPVDMVSLVEELGKYGEIAKVGGVEYVSDLGSRAVRSTSLEHYAALIREKSQRRRLIHVCEAAAAQAADCSQPLDDCFGQVEDSLLSIQVASTNAHAATAKEIVPAVLDEIATLRARTDDVIGLSTGIASLDTMTTGIRPDEYWVCGALPARGKTVLGVQIAATTAKRGLPVLMFSHEMTRRQVIRRILAGESKVPAKSIRNPCFMSNSEYRQLTEIAGDIAKWPFFVDDPEELSASELVARARLHIRRFGVKLIVVDYLQLVNAPGKETRDRVTAASNALRKIPKTEGVPVVALSQLARPRDRNENSRPSMTDLKESGSIEAHAHVVLLLYRPKDEHGRWTSQDEIIIAKQREGLVGWQPVRLDTDRLRFVERELKGSEGSSVEGNCGNSVEKNDD